MNASVGSANLGEIRDSSESKGSAGPEEQGFISGALLNRCPDPLKADLNLAVLLLKSRTAAVNVVDAAVFTGRCDKSFDYKGVFDERFRIKCSDVDKLVESLRESNELSPKLEGLIASLRLQFGALIHYFSRISPLGIGKVDECVGIMEEMRGCSKYPKRIFQNITLMRLLMKKASNFDEAQRVYQYLMDNKYTDVADGREKLVCKPDTKFFKLWFPICDKPRHFQILREAIKVNRCNKFSGLFSQWRSCCRSFSDFEVLYEAMKADGCNKFGGLLYAWKLRCSSFLESEKVFNCAIYDAEFKFDNQFFMFWLGRVRSLDQLLIVIESLFKAGIIPDQILVNRILIVVINNFKRDDAFYGSFMSKLDDIYANGSHNQALVFAEKFGQLYARLKGLFKR